MNEKWSVQSGLGYSWSKTNIDSATSYAALSDAGNVQFKFNPVLGYSYLYSPETSSPLPGDSISTSNMTTRLHYLTVPLVISYRLSMGWFTLVPSAGVTCNVLTQAILETDVN